MRTQRTWIWGGVFTLALLGAQACNQLIGYDQYDHSAGGAAGAGGHVEAGGTGGVAGMGGMGGMVETPTCGDNKKNGTESDIDCGGDACSPCTTGLACTTNTDCVNDICNNGACAPALCDDTVQNGTETDIDCGGPHCHPCNDGESCIGPADCASDVCVAGTCIATACDDGARNGDETDVDCGGSCPKCTNSSDCGMNADCESELCVNSTCQIPSCMDGVRNGKETDTDCGGSDCGGCDLAGTCGIDADCLTTYCKMGRCAAKDNGEACAKNIECASNQCVDDVCCESVCDGICEACNVENSKGTCSHVPVDTVDLQCVQGATCGLTGACAADGTCAFASTNTICVAASCNGTVLTEETKCDGMGACPMAATQNCAPSLCNAMESQCTTTCMDDMQCVAGTGYCTPMMTCATKVVDGQSCTGNNACISGFCVDGYCCNSACTTTCQACNVAGSPGVCANIPAQLPDTFPMDACAGVFACNGNAGSMACKKANGQTCMMANECASGQCVDGVCCDTACTGTCKACNVMGSAGTCSNVAANADDVGTCSGTNQSCDGAGACKVEKGQACSMATQCLTGNCVDGFCCDTACTESCKACSTAKTTKPNGTCDFVTIGTDPDNDCPTDPTSGCQRNGMCNGAGACQLYNNMTVCVTSTCSMGTQTNADTCNGMGMCIDKGTTNCSPYVCGATICKATCVTDADCVGTHFCAAPTCTAKRAAGQPCTGNNQCISTMCSMGLCL